jgi:hypothetical protein
MTHDVTRMIGYVGTGYNMTGQKVMVTTGQDRTGNARQDRTLGLLTE